MGGFYRLLFFDIAAYPAIRNKALLEHIDSRGITLFRDNPGVIAYYRR